MLLMILVDQLFRLEVCMEKAKQSCSLLLRANANPNLFNRNGATPFFMASQERHTDIVCLLLEANSNPNLHRGDGVTPLFIASQEGHTCTCTDIINLLLMPMLIPTFTEVMV